MADNEEPENPPVPRGGVENDERRFSEEGNCGILRRVLRRVGEDLGRAHAPRLL